MKNTLTLILIFTLGVLTGFSQRRPHKKSHKRKTTSYSGTWLGFNGSGVIKSLFSFSDPVLSDPYSMLVTFSLNKNRAIRIGTYLELQNNQNINNSSASTIDTKTGIRVGYQKAHSVHNGFYFYYGLDITYDYNRNFSSFDNINKSTQYMAIGAGPLIGFGYQLGKRFRMSTESTYYTKYGFSKERLDAQGVISEKNFQQFSILHLLPNSLYLTFRI